LNSVPSNSARLDLLDRGCYVKRGNAARQNLLRVGGDKWCRLGKQSVPGLEEMEAQLLAPDARVVTELVVKERRELAE